MFKKEDVMKVLLIRHAKTIFNNKGLFQGQYDCKLSDEGIESTKEFKKNFNTYYDFCYASPLERARITADIITGGKKIIYDSRLMEACLGEYEKTKITEEKLNMYVTGEKIPKGAETRDDVIKRVKSFLNDLKYNHKETDVILIVTHGGVIRAIKQMYNITDKEVKNLEMIEVNI